MTAIDPELAAVAREVDRTMFALRMFLVLIDVSRLMSIYGEQITRAKAVEIAMRNWTAVEERKVW